MNNNSVISVLNRYYGLLLNESLEKKECEEIIELHKSLAEGKVALLNPISESIKKTISTVNEAYNHFETIRRIGNDFCKESLYSQINCIYDDQCVFISDYPVEWANVSDVPLSFSNDVCRIGVRDIEWHKWYLDHFSKRKFSITTDILDKTFVVMCSPESLHDAYRKEISIFDKIGFKNYRICSSKDDFVNILQQEHPEVLLIDTHGDYQDSYSFLWMGDEKFRSDDLKKLDSDVIPSIIFLSACKTRPVAEIDDNIVDAFIEKGALAVTGAYVELNIEQGIKTISRLINNLKFAAQYAVHPNWLSFISHLERTFLLQTVYVNENEYKINRDKNSFQDDLKKLTEIDTENCGFYKKILSILSQIPNLDDVDDLDKVIDFDSIEEKYHLSKEDFVNQLDHLYKHDLLGLEQTVVGYSKEARIFYYKKWLDDSKGDEYPEHLYYINYGRMDLISFDSSSVDENSFFRRINASRRRVKNLAGIFEYEYQNNPMFRQSINDGVKKSKFVKVGRNDKCPCGSGLKFKKCCGNKR